MGSGFRSHDLAQYKHHATPSADSADEEGDRIDDGTTDVVKS